MSARRYGLSDFEWSVITPFLPDKPRGVARADDRRVLNGIYWRLRTGSPWADIPERYGPSTTCYNRFVRWRKLPMQNIYAEQSARRGCSPEKDMDAQYQRLKDSAAALNARYSDRRRALENSLSAQDESWSNRIFIPPAPPAPICPPNKR
jgi:hypothetical protein